MQKINSVRRSAYSLFSHDDVIQQQEGEQRLISHDSSCALGKKKEGNTINLWEFSVFLCSLELETVELKL